MKRPIGRLAPLLAGLFLAFGALPARSATIPLPTPCPAGISGFCTPGGADLGRPLFPMLRGPSLARSGGPDDPLLIVRGASGTPGTDAGEVLALARLVTAITGGDDARVWLLDADRPGQPGLFCLRFERRTWTAGHIGDFAVDLPQAAMIAARRGLLAMNAP